MSENKRSRIGIDIGFNQKEKDQIDEENERPSLSNDDPFYMAVLGDFSGRENRHEYDASTITKRRFIEIDRDNLDEVLASFNITLQLWFDDESDEVTQVPLKSLDDFHPDQLYQNVEIFAKLRSLHHRLKNNETFADAANELLADMGNQHQDAAQQVKGDEDQGADKGGLLDQLIEASNGRDSDVSRSGATMVDNLVKQIIAPYVTPGADPRQQEMLKSVEQAISTHMQFILHHPDFQALEACWLSLEFLTRRLETGNRIKIYILDVAQHELERDLGDDNVTESALYRKFCDPAPGDANWAILLGNYRFTDRVEDVMTLLNIGAVARKARAPFISAVNETLIGCESFAVTPDVEDWQYRLEPEIETAWSLLRNSDEAEYISMVVPRFLLRTPYGSKSRRIDAFDFEEMPSVHCHSCYLWGNGAFIKAEQLARAYSQQGWEMNPVSARDITQLPLHLYDEGGERIAKPCAEIQLTERGGQRILQKGLIPLWTVKNCDQLRSSDFHSLAI